jgi:hypothetical protein
MKYLKNSLFFIVTLFAGLCIASLAHAHGSGVGLMVPTGLGSLGLVGMAIPSLAQAKGYSVTGLGLEGIRQSLYDNALYPTAGLVQFLFFSQAKGSGLTTAVGAVAGTPKTIADTNLDVGGQLPAGKGFCVTSIEVPFYAGSVSTANTYTLAAPAGYLAQAAATVVAQANDINSFYQSGSLQLYIASKVCLEEAPLMRFPPKCALNLEAAISQAGTNATNAALWALSVKAAGRPYMVEPPIYFEPSVNFNVSINYPAVVATPSGFNARVGVILDGYMYRLT